MAEVAIPMPEVVAPEVGVLAGRRQIFTDYFDNINESNIETIIRDALKVHLQNANEIRYLMNYERGIAPIHDRVKEGRKDVDYRINENHAAEITTFKVGYVFSSPITLVQRAMEDNADSLSDDKRVATLNEMMFEQNKAAKDKKLAEDFTICGVGYRMALPKKYDDGGIAPFEILPLSPTTTFVVYSNDVYQRPVLGVSYIVKADGKMRIGAYTDTEYFELEGSKMGGRVRLVSTAKNGIGMVPIVEYRADEQRMGCFEKVLDLLDALSVMSSDRLNGLSQFVQNILWADNVTVTEAQKTEVKNGGWLFTKSDSNTKATIQYLTQQLDQNSAQSLVDWVYTQVLQITGTPAREKSSGGNTGQAIVLSNGWEIAETAAKNTEVVYKDSEYKFLAIILKILEGSKDAPENMKGLRLSDIEVKFSRNKTDSLLSKVQALQIQLEAGVEPLAAFKSVNLYDDPQQVCVDSKPYIEAKRKVTTDDKHGSPVDGGERDGVGRRDNIPATDE